jgi:hypothetical protein
MNFLKFASRLCRDRCNGFTDFVLTALGESRNTEYPEKIAEPEQGSGQKTSLLL